jgi:hypothetical protein
VLFPELSNESSWSSNNLYPPDNYSPGSHDKVDWICTSDKACPYGCHIWSASINKRTSQSTETGCPWCAHLTGYICPHDNLSITHPELIKDWSQKNECLPEEYSSGSNELVWWRCNKDQNHPEWLAAIYNRTKSNTTGMPTPTGCPSCNKRSYSKKAIQWLDSIAYQENIYIQHAESPEGEYRIPGTKYKADGWCQETNTIYEFHGDIWHGNPELYDPNEINRVNCKSYGELYRATIERENVIKSLGYILVTTWESEWDRLEVTLPEVTWITFNFKR